MGFDRFDRCPKPVRDLFGGIRFRDQTHDFGLAPREGWARVACNRRLSDIRGSDGALASNLGA